MTPKLSPTMAEMLEYARDFTDGLGGAVGVFAANIGQLSSLVALENRGLVVFHNWGRDINGEHENDVAIYQITDAGRQALAAVGSQPVLGAPDGAGTPG